MEAWEIVKAVCRVMRVRKRSVRIRWVTVGGRVHNGGKTGWVVAVRERPGRDR